MDSEFKLAVLDWLEGLKAFTHLGYAGAGTTWAAIPELSKYGAYLMIGSALVGVLADFASKYKARLAARAVPNPLANGG
jgi:hypothetical protein